MDIAKMLTLSTAHITKETADKLDIDCKPEYFKHGFCSDLGIAVYSKDEFGWLLYVPFAAVEKLPPDLEQCVRLAHENSCVWLCLDSDGLINPSLKTYNWDDAPEIDKWQAYLLYLKMWADAHNDKAFIGCCPVCYDEFIDTEYSEED